ncbi:hypothetical protein [Solimicrobium silvestre]|uniref:Uncharacterized protein n=1 Tax=Solimicrobium silvestre TaxID=2099400 RepID=A0A2S9GZB7_9BURK|nr:hypothetical protein [Solimicrobium silvestre]PRC93071.1 hypothetical protein S2091_2157 [Solimicrobium silvestre]
MKKIDATTLLGGTPTAAADAIGITYQAYSQWPDVLPLRLQDRVQAAIARKHLPPEVLGSKVVSTPASKNSRA